MAMNNGKNEKKKSNGLDIPQTKGNFQFVGYVSGCDSDKFYTDTLTKTNKPRRVVNFAVQYSEDAKAYVEVSGMESEFVYASRRVEKDGKKSNETRQIEWKNRMKPLTDDFRLIGVNVGVEQVLDEKGKYENKRMTLVPFDAAEYLSCNLKDGIPVFVKGGIEYSEYEGKHYKKFVPNQISRLKNEIDFEDPKYGGVANFNQKIVFKSITRPDDDKNEWIVNALIIGFSTVEEAEFYIVDKDLANAFRKELKEYYCIDVNGDVVVEKNEEEVASTNAWGRSDPIKAKRSPTTTKLVIMGADGDNIDKDTYSEDIIDEALARVKNEKNAKADYGDDDDSGSAWGRGKIKKNSEDEDDEDDAW